MGIDPVKKPAVFLDRDGTLNQQAIRDGKPFSPITVEDFRLFPGVQEGCRALKAAGFVIVVATNQPDVGRGELPQATVEAMHVKLLKLIPEIDRIEVCFDSGISAVSRRRKPEPGMLLDAAAALDLDLSRSWMIGDRWRDVDCAHKAGVKTVFIDFGYAELLRAVPDFIVKSFPEAVVVVTSR